MCEFCTKHGEGKKWYLQMRNYAKELLHEQLSAEQVHCTGAQTRLEWANRFWQGCVMPAMSGVTPGPSPAVFASQTAEEAKVEHAGQVLPIEDVERVLGMVDSITRMPCGCRFASTGLTDKRYCFGLGVDQWGVLGRFPESASSLEVLDRDEARRIIRGYDEEGLFHSIWTGVTPYVIGICNCDRDCGAYGGYLSNPGSQDFFRAEYVSVVDWNRCTGCKSCISQCQFGSMLYSSALAKVTVEPSRCFGCGVCRAACPSDAITLVPRETHAIAASIWH
jgi:NAD-dependent dihydropyrimidine dehydrogenase PreA subunit